MKSYMLEKEAPKYIGRIQVSPTGKHTKRENKNDKTCTWMMLKVYG